jgi:hypothetical protein
MRSTQVTVTVGFSYTRVCDDRACEERGPRNDGPDSSQQRVTSITPGTEAPYSGSPKGSTRKGVAFLLWSFTGIWGPFGAKIMPPQWGLATPWSAAPNSPSLW